MDNEGNIDLLTAFKRLLAENNSQQARLQEYVKIIESRDNKITMLQTLLTQANEYRSNTDSELKQLKELQHGISNIQQIVVSSGFMSAGRQERIMQTVSAEQRLQALNAEYGYLQLQIKDLQSQLLATNNRNLLLQQRTDRIAELESLLSKAKEEIGYWKARVNRQA